MILRCVFLFYYHFCQKYEEYKPINLNKETLKSERSNMTLKMITRFSLNLLNITHSLLIFLFSFITICFSFWKVYLEIPFFSSYYIHFLLHQKPHFFVFTFIFSKACLSSSSNFSTGCFSVSKLPKGKYEKYSCWSPECLLALIFHWFS